MCYSKSTQCFAWTFPHFRNSNIFSCTADLSWIDSYLQEVFMTYQTFKQQIRQSLQDAFGSDVSIILQDILKNNNTHLDGLTVLTPGCNISPTIYLNDYFHAYENRPAHF